MRSIAVVLAASLVAAACADNEPTSPGRSASGNASADVVRAQGKTQPPPAPTGFTKIQMVYSPQTDVPAGGDIGVTAKCPAGSTAIAANFTIGVVGAVRPFAHGPQVIYDNTTPIGYTMDVENTAPGSTSSVATLYVTCIS